METNVSDTPETQAQSANCCCCVAGEFVPAEFARKIERHRNAAWKTLKEIRQLFAADESFGAVVEVLFERPLEIAEAEIARLQSLENDEVKRGAQNSKN